PGKQPLTFYINKFKSWCIKAKLFVEYYTLLFIPFNAKYQFPEPYNKILPWNISTSWVQFWEIFNGFKNSKWYYEKTVYRIFRNMVYNMRQNKVERNLISKWRFKTADPRYRNTDATDKHYTDLVDDENIKYTADEKNNMRRIVEHLRTTFHHDVAKPNSIHEKAKKYLIDQTRTYRTLQQADTKIKKRKKFPKFSVEECKNLRKKPQLIPNKKKIPKTNINPDFINQNIEEERYEFQEVAIE
ncbi:MAG: hypothetical protein GY739_13785, partial [Mesoflavibacter sp.]|nr:hypothetical protein [Mesoflavibacter sp.]